MARYCIWVCVALFLILNVASFRTFWKVNHLSHSFAQWMVSVGGGGRGGNDFSSRPKTMIISPSTSSGSDELLILQNFYQIQSGASKKIGIIGTQDLTDNHKQMIELLAYALVLSGNHVYTSGGGNGTNIAVIKGALRACNVDLLTVILPQSLFRQPSDLQPLLMRVVNLIQQPENDDLELKEAANKCNEQILASVDKCLVFVYHSSNTILKSVENAKDSLEVIPFYLD